MTREERIRTLVDGELDELEAETLLAEAARDPELAAELEAATTLRASLAVLRAAEDAEPPADLVDRSVRRAVLDRARDEEAAAHGLARLNRWFVRPRSFRARPGALLLAAAAVALLALGGARWFSRRGTETDPGASRAVIAALPAEAAIGHDEGALEVSEVPVRFMLPASGARSVAVAGDFNEWRTDATPLVDGDGDGVFVGTVSLARGTYDYMFVVDGERWVTDPYANQVHEDGFGQRNAVLRLD